MNRWMGIYFFRIETPLRISRKCGSKDLMTHTNWELKLWYIFLQKRTYWYVNIKSLYETSYVLWKAAFWVMVYNVTLYTLFPEIFMSFSLVRGMQTKTNAYAHRPIQWVKFNKWRLFCLFYSRMPHNKWMACRNECFVLVFWTIW